MARADAGNGAVTSTEPSSELVAARGRGGPVDRHLASGASGPAGARIADEPARSAEVDRGRIRRTERESGPGVARDSWREHAFRGTAARGARQALFGAVGSDGGVAVPGSTPAPEAVAVGVAEAVAVRRRAWDGINAARAGP